MSYIKRRLLVSVDNNDRVFSEEEFFSLPGLKVVLGEPGAGKTSMVNNLLGQGAKAFSPRLLISGALKASFLRDQISVIDGIDEVSAYLPDGQSLINFFANVPIEFLPYCIVTCRVADWDASLGEADLTEIGCPPVVGTLLPFKDRDIQAFIEIHKGKLDGVVFFQQAVDTGAIELLRNPQMLLMFLQTVANGTPFPKTRTELFQKASSRLVTEDNDTHRILKKGRGGPNQLLRCSSFICAQLILGNKQGVDLNGGGDVDMASVSELVSDDFATELVRDALGTKLFRVSARRGTIEPCHRTVAEFLSAQFICQRLRETLSLRRLETYIYGPDYVIPAAFRGVHAWIATLDADVARDFIGRDPYGFLQYGDPENLPPQDVIFLVSCMEDLISDDPFFRRVGLEKAVGRGIARPELKEWLWGIICNPQKPVYLSSLLLQYIKNTPLADSLCTDLSSLVLNVEVDLILREAALEVAIDSGVLVDWVMLHSQLMAEEGFASFLLVKQLTLRKITLFSGEVVVTTLCKHAEAGYWQRIEQAPGKGLPKLMGNAQLKDALLLIKAEESAFGDNGSNILDQFRYEAMIEVVNRGVSLETETIVHELDFHRKTRGMLPVRHDPSSREGFAFNPETTRAIQRHVLYNLPATPGSSSVNFLSSVCPSLALSEDDAEYFLHMAFGIFGAEGKCARVWMEVAGYVMSVEHFSGYAKNVAIAQAKVDPELQASFDEAVERNRSVVIADIQLKRTLDIVKMGRHKKFEAIRHSLLVGEDSQTILTIAKRYIGIPFSQSILVRNDRLRELVGEGMLKDALRSFEAVLINHKLVPSVRQIARFRATYAPQLWWQPILVAYCIQVSDPRNINLSFGRSALALEYWEQFETFASATVTIFRSIRAVVLPDNEARKQFLRDFFEPFLKEHSGDVPRVNSLADDDFFSDLASDLAVGWIRRYRKIIRPETLLGLLRAAARSANLAQVLRLAWEEARNPCVYKKVEQAIWLGFLFGSDYERNRDFFTSFSSRGPGSLIGFQWGLEIIGTQRMTSEQDFYVIKTFADDLKYDAAYFPYSLFDDGPVLAYEFVYERVQSLATSSDPNAARRLELLIEEEIGPQELQDDFKDALIQNTRMQAERAMQDVTLEKIRDILLSGKPSNSGQLQAIVMDELYVAQRIVKSDPVSRYRFFWEGDKPKLENECRDLIVSILEPRLAKYGIRIYTESRMHGDTRSDILLAIGEVNLSIEVKCQWHKDLWTAAAGQLQDYAFDYRADGYGIYLVVFFGPISLPTRKIQKSTTGKRAVTGEELLCLLNGELAAAVPAKTHFFVWDVSRPSLDRGSRNLGTKTTI